MDAERGQETSNLYRAQVTFNHVFNDCYHVLLSEAFAMQFSSHVKERFRKRRQRHLNCFCLFCPERLNGFSVESDAVIGEIRGDVGYSYRLLFAVDEAYSV